MRQPVFLTIDALPMTSRRHNGQSTLRAGANQ